MAYTVDLKSTAFGHESSNLSTATKSFGVNMKQAIALVTWAGTIHLAKELLETSLKDYSKQVVVIINEVEASEDVDTLKWLVNNYFTLPVQGNRWEVGGLEAMMALTDFDEWILIQDTLEIKDITIFDSMFNSYGKSVSFGPGWHCYLGKYRREVLNQITLPVCLNKIDAIYHELITLPRMYNKVAEILEGQPVKVLFENWGNANPTNTYDYKFNRKNLVLGNPYIVKRKSLEYEIYCPILPNLRWSAVLSE